MDEIEKNKAIEEKKEKQRDFWRNFINQLKFYKTPHSYGSDEIIRNSLYFYMEYYGLSMNYMEENGKDEIIKKLKDKKNSLPPALRFKMLDPDQKRLQFIYTGPDQKEFDPVISIISPDKFVDFKQFDEENPTSRPRVSYDRNYGEMRTFHLINFGTSICTLIIRPEGIYINELKLTHQRYEKYGDIQFVFEHTSRTEFYEGNDLFEGLSLTKKPVLAFKDEFGDTRNISLVTFIREKIKDLVILPDAVEEKVFTDSIKRYKTVDEPEFSYMHPIKPGEIPKESTLIGKEEIAKMVDLCGPDFSYMPNVINANEEVMNRFIANNSEQIKVR